MRVGRNADDEGRDDDRRQAWVAGVQLVERAEEPAGPAERHTRLLARLAERGRDEVGVVRFPLAAGERDVSGPGIALVFGTLDEEQFELLAGSEHEGDAGFSRVGRPWMAEHGPLAERPTEEDQAGIVRYVLHLDQV